MSILTGGMLPDADAFVMARLENRNGATLPTIVVYARTKMRWRRYSAR